MESARRIGSFTKEIKNWYPLTRRGNLYAAGLVVAAVCYFNNPNPQISALVNCSPGDDVFKVPHPDVDIKIKNLPEEQQGIWLVVASNVDDSAFHYIGKGFDRMSHTIHGGMNASPKVSLEETKFKEDHPYTATVYDGLLEEQDPNFKELKRIASTQFTIACIE